MSIDASAVIVLALIMIRLSFLFLLSPIEAFRALPFPARMLLLITLAFTLKNSLTPNLLLTSTTDLSVLAINELINGFMLSLALLLTFGFIQASGQLLDTQLGLSALNLFNPVLNQHDSLFSRLFRLLASAIFFALSGPLLIYEALWINIKTYPLGLLLPFYSLSGVFNFIAQTFSVSLLIVMPIVSALFIIELLSAILVRNMPMLNIYFLILPIKILIGLVLLISLLPKLQTPLANMMINTLESLTRGMA